MLGACYCHATSAICDGRTPISLPPQASYLLSLTDTTPPRPKRAGLTGDGQARPPPSVRLYLVLGMAVPGSGELIKSANNNESRRRRAPRLCEVEIPGAAVIFILFLDLLGDVSEGNIRVMRSFRAAVSVGVPYQNQGFVVILR